MAYLSSDAPAYPAATPGWRARLTNLRERIATYRRKRDLYERTLRELQSYSRHDLLDLGISPEDLHGLARRHAGW